MVSRLLSACLLASLLSLLLSRDAVHAASTETIIAVVGRDFVMIGADSSVSEGIMVTASNLDKIAVLSEPFPTVAAAVVGDAADTDRLVARLRAEAALHEYASGVGCDVEYVDEEDEFDPSGDLLSPRTTAQLARGLISGGLRSPNPFQVSLFVAGLQRVSSGEDSLAFLSSRVQEQVRRAAAEARGADAKETKTSDDEGDSNNSVRISSTIDAGDDDQDKEGPTKTTFARTASKADAFVPQLFWLDELGSLQSLAYGAHGIGSNFCLSVLDQHYRPDLTQGEAAQLLRNCFRQLRIRYALNAPQPPCIKCIDRQGCRLIK